MEIKRIKINTRNYLCGRPRDTLNIIEQQEREGWEYKRTECVNEKDTYLVFEKKKENKI